MNLFIFILGTVIGSFINVCIYRIPRGESIAYPYSRCPQCGYRLAARDLIPILSFLYLRGKCRRCNAKISMRYPLVEFLTGAMFFLAFVKLGFSLDFLSAVTLISGLIISAFTDLEYQIIPDKIVLTTAVIGLLLNILIHGKDVLNYLMGSVLGGGTIFLIAALSQGGMGGGDIKLFAAVGLFLGMRLTLLSLLLSFILGATAGIILIVLKLKGIKDAIPFGPFIALGSIASLFAGDKIISWYFLKYVHI